MLQAGVAADQQIGSGAKNRQRDENDSDRPDAAARFLFHDKARCSAERIGCIDPDRASKAGAASYPILPEGGANRFGDQAMFLGGLWSGRISVEDGVNGEVAKKTPTDQKPMGLSSCGSASLAAAMTQPDISRHSGAFGMQGALFDAMLKGVMPRGVMPLQPALADAVAAPPAETAIATVRISDKMNLRSCMMAGNIWGQSQESEPQIP